MSLHVWCWHFLLDVWVRNWSTTLKDLSFKWNLFKTSHWYRIQCISKVRLFITACRNIDLCSVWAAQISCWTLLYCCIILNTLLHSESSEISIFQIALMKGVMFDPWITLKFVSTLFLEYSYFNIIAPLPHALKYHLLDIQWWGTFRIKKSNDIVRGELMGSVVSGTITSLDKRAATLKSRGSKRPGARWV